MTNKEYIIDKQLTNVRFILDMTTSTRTDRIKGKAQDGSVYKDLGFPHIFLIVLPDDEHFDSYEKPENEIKQCQKAVYDANFCNVYKKDNVSLILRKKDLMEFLHYVMKNEGKDINKLITSWKNRYYKDMATKRKADVAKYKTDTTKKVARMIKKDKIKD